MEHDVDGRPQPISETPLGFVPAGQPKSLTDAGAASAGGFPDAGGPSNAESKGRMVGKSAEGALADMGGLTGARRISSIKDSGKATLPDVPITADPANEGG